MHGPPVGLEYPQYPARSAAAKAEDSLPTTLYPPEPFEDMPKQPNKSYIDWVAVKFVTVPSPFTHVGNPAYGPKRTPPLPLAAMGNIFSQNGIGFTFWMGTPARYCFGKAWAA